MPNSPPLPLRLEYPITFTHGASKKVSSLRCNLDVVRVDERELWAPAKTAIGRLLQGPRCNFYFLQGCVCKDADVIFTMNK